MYSYQQRVRFITLVEMLWLTRLRLVSAQKIFTTWMTRIVVDKLTNHAKLHFDLFFTTISTNKENDFFLERQLKKTSRDTLI